MLCFFAVGSTHQCFWLAHLVLDARHIRLLAQMPRRGACSLLYTQSLRLISGKAGTSMRLPLYNWNLSRYIYILTPYMSRYSDLLLRSSRFYLDKPRYQETVHGYLRPIHLKGRGIEPSLVGRSVKVTRARPTSKSRRA